MGILFCWLNSYFSCIVFDKETYQIYFSCDSHKIPLKLNSVCVVPNHTADDTT